MDTLQTRLAAMRRFFQSGTSKDPAFRKQQLRLLKAALAQHEDAILAALQQDLGKHAIDGYTSELLLLYEEIDFCLKHLKRWCKPRRKPTPMAFKPGKSCVFPEPYGLALIMAPWNYPVQLLFAPLIAAIAAGNVAALKPSEVAPAVSRLVSGLVSETFAPDYIACFPGDAEMAKALLAQQFDYIFYTGSTAIGRLVMAAAARRLTPVTLELGGKSPCIVDKDIPIATAARRIAWGKFYNAGQTCVAPDYVYVHQEIHEPFVNTLQDVLRDFYGPDAAQSPEYGRIINRRHYDRLQSLNAGSSFSLGTAERSKRFIPPTIIDNATWDHPAMAEEIFGPILPVLVYRDLQEALDEIRRRPHPLALYVFSRHKQTVSNVVRSVPSGGVCVNDTIKHLSTPHLPFGGVGDSGMGRYHGKAGFDTFSHYRSLMHRSFWPDIKILYPPYKMSLTKLKRVLKWLM